MWPTCAWLDAHPALICSVEHAEEFCHPKHPPALQDKMLHFVMGDPPACMSLLVFIHLGEERGHGTKFLV